MKDRSLHMTYEFHKGELRRAFLEAYKWYKITGDKDSLELMESWWFKLQASKRE